MKQTADCLVQHAFEQFDHSQNRKLDYEEFKEWIEASPQCMQVCLAAKTACILKAMKPQNKI